MGETGSGRTHTRRAAPPPPAVPADVAHALQRPTGSVSVRYTVPASLAHGPSVDTVLMETPYEQVLAALTLDTKHNLRFVRTGNRAEGARIALVNVAPLLAAGRHWIIDLTWDADELRLAVHDQHAHDGPVLEGRWPRSD